MNRSHIAESRLIKLEKKTQRKVQLAVQQCENLQVMAAQLVYQLDEFRAQVQSINTQVLTTLGQLTLIQDAVADLGLVDRDPAD